MMDRKPETQKLTQRKAHLAESSYQLQSGTLYHQRSERYSQMLILSKRKSYVSSQNGSNAYEDPDEGRLQRSVTS